MLQRLDGGRPIREAIRRASTSIPEVAARTKEIDPTGAGISQTLIGFYTSTGRSARETASERTAQLIAKALGVSVEEFFSPTDG